MAIDPELHKKLEKLGQNRLIRHLENISPSEQKILQSELNSLDWKHIEELLASKEEILEAGVLEAAVPCNLNKNLENEKNTGEDLIKKGQVAAFIVAGGQGSRLGFEGPKGFFGVTPVLKRSLFEVFALKIRAIQDRYGITIPWVFMTSPQNNQATKDFFAKNNYFGLNADQFFFFIQGVLPAIDFQTNDILLISKTNLALSPNGTGGIFKGLYDSGALEWLKKRGIKYLSYFQVDNPLVKIIDPLFIGSHALSGSEFSTKTIIKACPEEKVGILAKKGGKLTIVEYIDLPTELSQKRDAQGNLIYGEANTAIHMLNIDFVDKIAKSSSLPIHRAVKKESFWNNGVIVKPEKPNAIKFEQFVFGALPLANNPIIFRSKRENEFSPVKNAEGVDSPISSKRDQLREWTKWLKAAGIEVPINSEGTPIINFEISPLFADNEEALITRYKQGLVPAKITEGLVLE